MSHRSDLPARYSAAVDQQSAAIRDRLPRIDPTSGLIADLIIGQYAALTAELAGAHDLSRDDVITMLGLMNLAMVDAIHAAVQR